MLSSGFLLMLCRQHCSYLSELFNHLPQSVELEEHSTVPIHSLVT